MRFENLLLGIIPLIFVGCGVGEGYSEINSSTQELPITTTVSPMLEEENVTIYTPSPTPTPLYPRVEEEDRNRTVLLDRLENGEEEVQSYETVETPTENSHMPSTISGYGGVQIGVGSGSSDKNETSNISTISSEDYRYRFINSSNCDQIVDKEFLLICYDFKLKSAKSVSYTLEGDLVNELNLQERPPFYEERLIDGRYRVKVGDYRGSGYDRGHLAPDGSFDWSQESLEATYSLANIIPQSPTVNRTMWVKVEQYARDKAVELGTINIINVVKFEDSPKHMGKSKMAISTGYYKILYNMEESYEECFYYKNDLNINEKNDNLSLHRVKCSEI